eukprot:4296503-Amphidinium_carterae.1
MFFCVVGVLDYELAKQKTTVGELSRQANKYTMTSSRSAMDQNQLHSKEQFECSHQRKLIVLESCSTIEELPRLEIKIVGISSAIA